MLFRFVLCLGLLGVYVNGNCPEDLDAQVNVTTEVVFTPPTMGVGLESSDPFTPVWYYNGSTYFVWIDAAYRPWVSQIPDGMPAITVPLDPDSDYQVQPDGHHRFSMGIDNEGFIHITGDMHNYNYLTTAVINPYPVRYQEQKILYWKSNASGSVAQGFTFAGGLNNPAAIPGSGWTTGHFFADNNGVLYYTSMIHAIEGGNLPGEQGVGLYQYNSSTQVWTALGGLADNIRQGTYNVTLFWENSGWAPLTWFQNFWPSFNFDADNRLHFAVATNTNTSYAGNDTLIYAASYDGGITWQKASGATIPGVPIRGITGNPNQGDVVFSDPSNPNLSTMVSAVPDRNGAAGVGCGSYWYIWNGANWIPSVGQNFLSLPTALWCYPGKNLTCVISSAKLLRVNSFSGPDYGTDFLGYENYVSVNAYGLKSGTGSVYAVGTNTTSGNTQSVLKTTVQSAPLPCGWQSKDIALTPPNYRSSAAFINNQFVSTNYGTGINNVADGFHYIYKTLSGDGSISAYVTSSNGSAQGYSRAGLMIRQDLSADCINISILLAPGTANKGLAFTTRYAKHRYSEEADTAGVPTPYWLKLTRAGNIFTAYTSPDGFNWTQAGQSTVVMPPNVLIGLAASSYANGYLMQTATFSNIQAPL